MQKEEDMIVKGSKARIISAGSFHNWPVTVHRIDRSRANYNPMRMFHVMARIKGEPFYLPRAFRVEELEELEELQEVSSAAQST
jgi:hypothetical protein